MNVPSARTNISITTYQVEAAPAIGTDPALTWIAIATAHHFDLLTERPSVPIELAVNTGIALEPVTSRGASTTEAGAAISAVRGVLEILKIRAGQAPKFTA